MRKISLFAVTAIVLAFAHISSAPAGQAASASPATLAQPGPWRALIEKASAPAWRGWTATGLPVGWRVVDGVLSKDTEVDDLVTAEPFGNFELELE